MNPPILLPAHAPNVYTAARLYAALGFSTLPVRGKQPALSFWAHLQQRCAVAETIDLWHKAGLLEGVGIICGAVSGNLVVLDLDGEDAISAFLNRFPNLPDTYTVTSGSGRGAHFYYSVRDLPPTTRATGLKVGNVELRSNGAYVVVPPSIHPSGKPYTVRSAAEILHLENMREQVAWIKSLIQDKHGGVLPPASTRVVNATAYGRSALASEAKKVWQAVAGTRNLTLYVAALKLGSLIADAQIGASDVERVLFDAARALSESDGAAATRRTIASGINRGMESSRDRYHKRA